MRSIVALLAGLMFASGLSAQATCPTDGIVLHGWPSDVAAVGPTGADSRPLTQGESEGAVLIVECRDGYLIHASREDRNLNYSSSTISRA